MITVHMIGNAHIDPVWLWQWPAGLVEALATCRTAADLAEEYADFVFTRSDVWIYERLEGLDPALFARIRRLSEQGRWQPVGGWYVQPDCNLPTAESFRRHMSLGKAYFREKLGVDVTVGYNVDSFGHAATLPRFLAEAGCDSYVMMRPMKHEMTLPASLFRWRCGEAEVVTWRIPRSYTAAAEDLTEHIRASLQEADPRIGHVMCFYGVGDHGGGPTSRQIRWIMEHRTAIPDAELVFSHPRRFFDAVAPFRELMPVVEEELQYHAVGCYSALVDIKQDVRRAEHGLLAAESALERRPAPPAQARDGAAPRNAAAGGVRAALQDAWKKVLFNQFHDIYAGTSIAPACRDALDQLGAAADAAKSIVTDLHVREMGKLPPDPEHRIVVFNTADVPFSGIVEHEPWMAGRPRLGRLVDESGTPVPSQTVGQPLMVGRRDMLLWEAELGPQEMKVYRLLPEGDPDRAPGALTDLRGGRRIENRLWRAEAGRGSALLHVTDARSGRPLFRRGGLRLEVLRDHSDTWSHGIPGFGERRAGAFRRTRHVMEEIGPLRAALRIDSVFGCSRASLWVRLRRASPEVEINVHLDWREKLKLVKLVLPFADPVQERTDGIPGGSAARPQNGREFPLTDWTAVGFEGDAEETWKSVGLAAPDCFGLDGVGSSVRFTLCRSPAYAWHDPAKIDPARFIRWIDQGEHDFRFVLAPEAEPEELRRRALTMHRPPVCYDWTAGMEEEPRRGT